MAPIERCAALGNERIRGDLARVFELVIVEIQRELEGTARDHHVRLVPVVALARDGVVIADGKIILRQVARGAKFIEQLGKPRLFRRFRFILRRRFFLGCVLFPVFRWFLHRRNDGRQLHDRGDILGSDEGRKGERQQDGKQRTNEFSYHGNHTSNSFVFSMIVEFGRKSKSAAPRTISGRAAYRSCSRKKTIRFEE